MVIRNVYKQLEDGKRARRLIYLALVRKLNEYKASEKV